MEALDSFVEWWSAHWRKVVYSFLADVVVAVTLF